MTEGFRLIYTRSIVRPFQLKYVFSFGGTAAAYNYFDYIYMYATAGIAETKLVKRRNSSHFRGFF